MSSIPYKQEQINNIGRELAKLIRARNPGISDVELKAKKKLYFRLIVRAAIELISSYHIVNEQEKQDNNQKQKNPINKLATRVRNLKSTLEEVSLDTQIMLSLYWDSSGMLTIYTRLQTDLEALDTSIQRLLKLKKTKGTKYYLDDFIEKVLRVFRKISGHRLDKNYKEKRRTHSTDQLKKEFNDLLKACYIHSFIASPESLVDRADEYIKKRPPLKS